MSHSEEYYLDKGDPLYEPLITYCAGSLALISLHDSKIRAEISALPIIRFDSHVKGCVVLPMELFRPWLKNLHKASNQLYLVTYTTWLAEKVLAVSNQLLKDQRLIDKSPLLEFMRHIRNGVSHGNRFNFKSWVDKEGILHQEPTLPAVWRGLEITKSLEDKKSMRVVPDFLNIGDVFLLLHDVNHYVKRKIIC